MRKYVFVVYALVFVGLFASCGTKEVCLINCVGGQQCVQGSCQCSQGQTSCEGQCTDLQSSPLHCGACGRACLLDQRCDQGACVNQSLQPCSSKLQPTSCGSACVNLQTDAQHCGACNQACDRNKRCAAGQCQCPSFLTACDNRCVDVLIDVQHCGGCGKKCPEGRKCAKGRCVASCPGATPEDCYGGCVDTNTNRLHCGACGNACPLDQPCIGGKCTCPPDWTLCDGRCVDTKTNWEHCGSCGSACTGGACSDGRCVATCPAATPQLCGGGCFNLQQNDRHCGSCFRECDPGQECQAGACTCPPQHKQCGRICADLQTNPDHCGTCDNVCSVGLSCTKGQCACAPDKTSCGGVCTDLQTATEHCGACGNKCKDGESCQGGTCQRQLDCQGTQIPCGGICVDPKTSNDHCGKCGLACGAAAACRAGICESLGPCTAGQTQPCGPDTETGECKKGTLSCIKKPDGTMAWDNACKGAITPKAESCDGKDNDCDGKVDNQPGGGVITRPCYTGPGGTEGVGQCKAGTQSCQNGRWSSACNGEIKPVVNEVCGNQKDDNCDGQVDEKCVCQPGKTQSCGRSSTGVCRLGSQTCSANGTWGNCVGEVKASNEVCDNKDNDCDGQTDEGLTRSCYTGPSNTKNVGPCRSGTQSCSRGAWGSCQGQVIPTSESCDGKDNDCDGQIDEDFRIGQSCAVGVGACRRTGVNQCTGPTSAKCSASEGQSTSEKCNGIDDDCNGQIDDKLGINLCYTGPIGTVRVGECHEGFRSCVNGQWSTTCKNETLPTAEVCNGKDDDCDGNTDEGVAKAGACTWKAEPQLKIACLVTGYLCSGGQFICDPNGYKEIACTHNAQNIPANRDNPTCLAAGCPSSYAFCGPQNKCRKTY